MRRSILVATAVAALILIPAAPTLAAEPASTTGCPASSEVLVVADLAALGYRVPSMVDAEGNANGLICAKPLNPVVQEKVCPAEVCGVDIVYYFRDDSLTS